MSNRKKNQNNRKLRNNEDMSSTNDRGKDDFRNSKSGRGRSGGRKSQGRKPDRRDEQSGRGPGDDKSKKLSSLNDLSWYTRYPELVTGTARVAFPYRPGRVVPVGTISTIGSDVSVTPFNAEVDIPGVMELRWLPSVGYSNSVVDPASVAGKELYSKVRKSFSSDLDADAPDFVIYLMAFDSVFSYIGKLKRIYRILDAYSANNYAMPDALLYAQGLTAAQIKDLRAHKAEFYTSINQLVYLSRKFMVPNVMDIFSRHYWLNDNVYTDDATINSQFYVFNQIGFYKFGLSSGTVKHGMLSMVQDPVMAQPTVTTGVVQMMYDFGANLISAIAESSDGYTISGYLMRAYEGAPTFIVENLGLDEEFKPVFVPEVLMQIENSAGLFDTDVNVFSTINQKLAGLEVTQDPSTNAIIHTPWCSQTVTFGADLNMPLSIRSDLPSEGDVIIATRFKPVLMNLEEGADPQYEVHCGTEIPIGWYLWYPTTSQGTTTWMSTHVPQFARISLYGLITAETAAVQQLTGLLYKSQFDWCPISYVLVDTSANSNEEINSSSVFLPVGDVHNFTTMTDEALAKLHEVCIYSELNAFDA